MIQGKPNSKVIEHISIETFQEHFTKLTSGNKINPNTDASKADDSLRFDSDPLLNLSLLKKLEKVIKILKQNKTSGHDTVTNEFLKHSTDQYIQDCLKRCTGFCSST